MAANGTEHGGTDAPAKPAWLQYLDEDLARFPEPEAEVDFDWLLTAAIKEYLLCDDVDAAVLFARRFDDLYATVYEPKFNGYNRQKKGWTGYLIAFYDKLFEIAMAMRYHDPLQDKLIRLLDELRKLPPHAVKIFVQPEFAWLDSEIWVRDPLLPWELLQAEPCEPPHIDFYNMDGADGPEVAHEFESDTARWVDAYAFEARCTAAGFNEGHRNRLTNAGEVIAIGLQPGYPSNLPSKMDCHIMAAAQYILLAGDAIDAECVKKQLPPHRHHGWKGWADGNGSVVWKQWGDRLADIAAALDGRAELDFRLFEENTEALKDMVMRARDKMVALEPELFAQPGPDSAPS